MTENRDRKPGFNELVGRMERERKIPGLHPVAWREYCYILDQEKEDFPAFLNKLIDHIKPLIVKSGGIVVDRCKIKLPNGDVYQAVSYKGDIKG